MADDDSNQIEKIDLEKVDWKSSREFFESLGEELDKLDSKDEAYDFTWVGKRKAIIEAGAPINKTLRPNVDESKDWDSTENLFIEGDNLDALKLLQESYLGKVKMIYIDPPYNTGRNLIYKNDFKVDKDTYQIEEGSVSEYGDKLRSHSESEGRFHSEWCSMFYSRVKVCRNLMTEDGVFVCTMDDSEIANTMKICDEIFGEDNRIGNIVVENNPRGRTSNKFYATSHEYYVIYAKNAEKASVNDMPLTKDQAAAFSLEDDESKYRLLPLRKSGAASRRNDRPKQFYPIYVDPKTLKGTLDAKEGWDKVLPIDDTGEERVWKIGSEKCSEYLINGNIVIKNKSSGGYSFSVKDRIKDGRKAKTVWVNPLYDASSHGATLLLKLFGKKLFDYPKSIWAVRDFLYTVIGNDKDAIVLDFFCGSGTTAHAVTRLNAEDGGDRRWIMVQLPEKIDHETLDTAGEYNNIAEISRERIRLSGEKIKEEFKDELAKREKPLDVGFRTLTVADTNYKEVFKSVGQHTQESLLDTVDNVKEDRSELDLLYGVLVQSAFELNRPLENKELSGADVYVYDYFGEVSGLVACFADSVPEEAIKEIAKLKPLTAVFKDSSFESSQDKVNLAEHFRIISPDTKVKVV